MRITEIDKIKSIRSWALAQADAEQKGLELTKQSHVKVYTLVPKNYSEIAKKLEAQGIDWTVYRDLIGASITNIKDYPEAAKKILSNISDPDKIISNIKDRRREKAFNELKKLQEDSLQRPPHGRPQLFVPRPQVLTNKNDSYYRQFAYDASGNQITEAKPILAPGIAASGPGRNKPSNAFWTSSLKKEYEQNGIVYYGSEWIDFVCYNMPDSYNNIGYVYKINPSARILTLNSDYDVKDIYRLYRELGADLTPSAEYTDSHFIMASDFPWQEIKKHWDAIYHNHNYGNEYGFTYGYDCESSAWFNTNVLEYMGKVRIRDIDWSQDN